MTYYREANFARKCRYFASLDVFDMIGGGNPKLWGLSRLPPSNFSALPQIGPDSGFRITDQADTVS